MELIIAGIDKQFTSIEEAIVYALKDRFSAKLLSTFLTTSNPKFAAGEGYVQHPKEDVENFREIIQFVYGREANITDTVSIKDMRAGLEKLNLPYLEKMWNRVACMDNEGREWSQPYYATESNNTGRAGISLVPETDQPWKN